MQRSNWIYSKLFAALSLKVLCIVLHKNPLGNLRYDDYNL